MGTATATITPEERLLAAIEQNARDFPELTRHDRCDACLQVAVAQVKVLPLLPNVLLCGHHFRKNLTLIQDRAYAHSTEYEDGMWPAPEIRTIDDDEPADQPPAQPALGGSK